jgi:hypothetical protein
MISIARCSRMSWSETIQNLKDAPSLVLNKAGIGFSRWQGFRVAGLCRHPYRVSSFSKLPRAGSNYNNQFLYILAIAFDKTHILFKGDVLSIQAYTFPTSLMRYVES